MLSGGSLTRSGATFSTDGKTIYVPLSNVIRKYSALNGEVCGSLVGHEAEVACIIRHPSAKLEVISGALDGTINTWMANDDTLLNSFNIGHPVEHMASTHKGHLLVSVHWREGLAGRIIAVSVESGNIINGYGSIKTSRPGTPLVSTSCGTLAATFDRNSILVWSNDTERFTPLALHHTKPITCVSLDAHNDILAAGDVSGRIVMWHSISAHLSSQRPVPSSRHCTTLHWHSQPVGCLCFSEDSTFLYSGGVEGVLVQWQVETNNANYLPRLGGGLKHLDRSPGNPAHLCITQADNSIRVINTADFKAHCSIHGIRPPPKRREALELCARPVVQPTSGLLVVADEHAVVQFYDLQHDRQLAKMQVTPRNLIPHTDAGSAAPLDPIVSHLAFSTDAKVMVSVDVQPDTAVHASTVGTLKFWETSSSPTLTGGRAPYAVNTMVDSPHSGAIRGVAYHPKAAIVATVGGCEFKLWARTSVSAKPGAAGSSYSQYSVYWRCRSVGSYRQLQLTCCAFSTDGSLLAVAADRCVTLWALPSCTLAAVLRFPTPTPSTVKQVVFVPRSSAVVGVLSGSDTNLVVWNLLTASVWWSTTLPVTCLAVDPDFPQFAVAVAAGGLSNTQRKRQLFQKLQQQGSPEGGKQQDAKRFAPPVTRVLVFKASSSVPIFGGSCGALPVRSLMYAPPGCSLHSQAVRGAPEGMSPLLLVTVQHSYAFFQSTDSAEQLESGAAVASLEDVQVAAEHLLTSAPVAPRSELTTLLASTTLPAMFSAPSHVLPPASQLCTAFLEGLVA